MLQLVILAAVIYILARWLRRPDAPPRPPRGTSAPKAPSGQVEEMVQDPVCGTWVPASQALRLEWKGQSFHFCSQECRGKFRQRPPSA